MSNVAADALAEPGTPVGAGFMASYMLAFLGLWMAFFAPIQVLLARQMEGIAPLAKESALGWVTGVGALVALVANPVCGALSDRTTARLGRRRPWILAGAVGGASALAMLGRQTSVAGALAWWCVTQFALNALMAALVAELPDQVPVAQRARCGALVGITQPLGVVFGTLLAALGANRIGGGYLLVGFGLMACVAPFLLHVRDASLSPAQRPTWSARGFLAGFRRDAGTHPDYARAWCMRFLVQLGSALGTLFLLYFLRDAIGYERQFPGQRAEDGLVVLVLVYTVGVVVGATASGWVSDRIARRRPGVLAGSVLMALAAAALGLWPRWHVALGAAGVLGIGYGVYVAVEQALMSQLLPAAGARGKDLGVLNAANAAPQVFGPALAAVLVTRLGGYPALYLLAAGVTLAGGLLVLRIRTVA